MNSEVDVLDLIADIRSYIEYMGHVGEDGVFFERAEAGRRGGRVSSSAAPRSQANEGNTLRPRAPSFARSERVASAVSVPPPAPKRAPGVSTGRFGPSSLSARNIISADMGQGGGSISSDVGQSGGSSSAPTDDKTRKLKELVTELGPCSRCALAESRRNIVFGAGSPSARLMLIGGGPQAEEDNSGEPFRGAVGELLDRILRTMLNLSRESVYVGHVVKCRPPPGRAPSDEEVSTCLTFITSQIEILRPDAILTLGPLAARTLLREDTPLARLRGTWYTFREIPLLPTFHPALLLRDASLKKYVRDDMLMLKAFLERLK